MCHPDPFSWRVDMITLVNECIGYNLFEDKLNIWQKRIQIKLNQIDIGLIMTQHINYNNCASFDKFHQMSHKK